LISRDEKDKNDRLIYDETSDKYKKDKAYGYKYDLVDDNDVSVIFYYADASTFVFGFIRILVIVLEVCLILIDLPPIVKGVVSDVLLVLI
jgi:hypothetical protein